MSLFSQQLQSCPDVDSNTFSDFSQFAGGDSEEDSKSLQVFLPMCQVSEDSSTLPYISTKVKLTAKVIEVIGYLCYLYTKQNRQPPLLPNVDVYMLYLGKKSSIFLSPPSSCSLSLLPLYAVTCINSLLFLACRLCS